MNSGTCLVLRDIRTPLSTSPFSPSIRPEDSLEGDSHCAISPTLTPPKFLLNHSDNRSAAGSDGLGRIVLEWRSKAASQMKKRYDYKIVTQRLPRPLGENRYVAMADFLVQRSEIPNESGKPIPTHGLGGQVGRTEREAHRRMVQAIKKWIKENLGP